ncbi:hypothetical protein Prudu_002758 [Prunus dulcis]|uniref:Protein FLX-like 3 n=1 Tax=Prunus dulcis TaxID=3755 RepID=A0A4Y1QRH7_PRUDU|nr:hypothetical protein Prudu_002758 [Prunus dulcis]
MKATLKIQIEIGICVLIPDLMKMEDIVTFRASQMVFLKQSRKHGIHRDARCFRIIAENRLVIDDNTLLQRELTDAKDEIHRLGQVLPKLRAEKEAQSRELIERGLKLEADLRATEPIKAEVIPLRAEVQKLSALRQELSSQVQGLTQEITRLQAENQQLIPMRADIDGMRNELVETRRAYEYERKASEEQVEQKQAMENNLVSMARGGGYGMMNGSPDMRYSRGSYGNGYSSGWGPYDKRGSRR